MKAPVKRIALVRLGSLGDIVHTLPVANRLKREWPECRLSWLVEPEHKALLTGHPDIDEIFTLDTAAWRANGWLKSAAEIKACREELQRRGFDLALELQGLIKSALAARFTGAPVRVGYAWSDCREAVSSLLTNRHVHPVGRRHVIERNLAFLPALGLAEGPWDYNLIPTEPAQRYIREFLREWGLCPERLAGINPGAAWPTKRWGAKKFAQLADILVTRLGLQVVLIWGPGEEGLVREIKELMTHTATLACPTDVQQLLALLSQCRMLVSGDTGPLHLAAAVKTSCVAVFGPTDPLRNGPYGERHEIIRHKILCSDCYKRRCVDVKCLAGIEPDEVFAAAGRVWEKINSRITI